jgi:hypothetical protein
LEAPTALRYIAGGVTTDEKGTCFGDRHRQSFLKAEIISPVPFPMKKSPPANEIFMKSSAWSKDVQGIKNGLLAKMYGQAD